MMNWDYNSGWMPWLMMFPMMLIVWGAVAWVIVAAIRHGGDQLRGGSRSGQGAGPNAMQLLDERLARGEIDVQEYRERRDALRSN